MTSTSPGWLDRLRLPAPLRGDLGDNDRAFLSRMFAKPISHYCERLRGLGFERRARVLDAAAGFGQWTLACAALNESVVGFDIDPRRMSVLSEICALNGVSNIHLLVGGLERIGLAPASFDAVFCYGALCFADVSTTLREFARVLRPGGLLYVSGDDLGSYLHMIVTNPNPTADYSARRYAWCALLNSLFGRRFGTHRAAVTSSRSFPSKLAEAGFRLRGIGGDGMLATAGGARPKPYFRSTFLGIPAAFECLAERL